MGNLTTKQIKSRLASLYDKMRDCEKTNKDAELGLYAMEVRMWLKDLRKQDIQNKRKEQEQWNTV